jgi:hypothetical protein
MSDRFTVEWTIYTKQKNKKKIIMMNDKIRSRVWIIRMLCLTTSVVFYRKTNKRYDNNDDEYCVEACLSNEK